MALVETHPLPAPLTADHRSARGPAIAGFWKRFFTTAFNPYRPELHYMRGPGPAWRAKHGMDAPVRLQRRDL